jgi:hypothetical protein
LQFHGHPELATDVPSVCQSTPCGALSLPSFSIPVTVQNLAVQAMQGESLGDRPRAMGIFKGSSEQGQCRCSPWHEQGQLYARAPLRLPSNVSHFDIYCYSRASGVACPLCQQQIIMNGYPTRPSLPDRPAQPLPASKIAIIQVGAIEICCVSAVYLLLHLKSTFWPKHDRA